MYKGQNFEDKIIDELFPEGFASVLDIGANGIELSNTYYFIEKGSNAILVEPSPKAYANLKKLYRYNSRINIFNVAIGNENGTMPFFESGTHLNRGDIGLLSTLDEKETEKWKPFGNTFEKISVPVWDFKSLMEHSPQKEFDLISIDCEGVDIDILKQMNLAELGCKCLCIEWNGIEEAKKEITDYVSQFGMKLHHQNLENLIFIL